MILRIIFFSLVVCSCSQKPEEPGDDYVLIEFASKLEEDYKKLNLEKSNAQIIRKD